MYAFALCSSTRRPSVIAARRHPILSKQRSPHSLKFTSTSIVSLGYLAEGMLAVLCFELALTKFRTGIPICCLT